MVAVEKAVAVVMQEGGRRALFDATQRLGANYREKAGLINSSLPGNVRICLSVLSVYKNNLMGSMANWSAYYYYSYSYIIMMNYCANNLSKFVD